MIDIRRLAIFVFCLVITPAIHVSGFQHIALGGVIEFLLGGIFFMSILTFLFWILEKIIK